MTARTITISLEAASMIAKMLPQASTMNMQAMMAASEFLDAVLKAPEDEPKTKGPRIIDCDKPETWFEDDGLGDRATR